MRQTNFKTHVRDRKRKKIICQINSCIFVHTWVNLVVVVPGAVVVRWWSAATAAAASPKVVGRQ